MLTLRMLSGIALCLATLLCSCKRSDVAQPVVKVSSPRDTNRSLTSQQSIANPAESDNVPGDLILPDGSKFRTTLYELKVIGQLPTAKKLPYFILSGRGCNECDANTSIYVHSPSDGPMKNEGKQPRFPYPGRLSDNEADQLVYESRMFYGNCLPDYANAVVWFERGLG